MNDTLEERLSERLHRLADDAEVPGFAPADDVRRGRGRQRRNRVLGVAGSALAVAALAGAAVTVGPGPADDRRAQDPPAAEQPRQPQGPQLADAPGAREAAPAGRIYQALGEVLAEGTAKYRISDLSAVTAVLVDELDGQPWVKLGVGAAPTWRETGATECPSGWTCEDVDVKGASRAKLASKDGVSQVAAQFPDQVVVVSISKWNRVGELAYTGTVGPDAYFAVRGD